jgi:hypothetical protein
VGDATAHGGRLSAAAGSYPLAGRAIPRSRCLPRCGAP